MSKRRFAIAHGLAAVGALILLGACAGTPPKPTDADLVALAKSRRAEDICRVEYPTGSHIESWVCLTPQQDADQRAMAQNILRRGLEAPWRPP
jgi:hypothetical protein